MAGGLVPTRWSLQLINFPRDVFGRSWLHRIHEYLEGSQVEDIKNCISQHLPCITLTDLMQAVDHVCSFTMPHQPITLTSSDIIAVPYLELEIVMIKVEVCFIHGLRDWDPIGVSDEEVSGVGERPPGLLKE